MTLSIEDYAVGAAFALLVLGGSIAVAKLLTRRLMPELAGVPQALAVAILATTVLVAVHLVPAALGILGRTEVAVTTAVAMGLALLLPAREGARTPHWPEPRSTESRFSDRVAIAGCAVVSVYLLAIVLALGDVPATNVDTLTFHLPGVARWIETGTIWQIDQFVPDQAHGYYPNTGNVVELAAVLPWRSDFLIRLIALPFVAIAGVATYGIGRELRAARTDATLVAAVTISIPAVTVYAVERPIPDAVALAGFAAGAMFLLRHNRTGLLFDLVLAGLGLGLALGTKWYGVSAVLAVIGVWAIARLAGGRALKLTAREAGILIGVTMAVGGIWLLRNWIESGNPLFPLELSILGVTIFDAPRDVIREQSGFAIAHYLFDFEAWREFILPAYRDFLALPAAVLVLGSIAWLVGFGVRERRRAADALVLAVAALAVALLYLVTPGGALGPEGAPGGAGVNSRYVVPALILAAGPCALLLGRLGRWRHVVGALALIAILDGLRQAGPVSVKQLAAAGIVIAFAIGAWILLRRRPRQVVIACGAAVILIASGLGFALQERFNGDRYRQEPVLGRFSGDLDADRRVGIAGFYEIDRLQPVLPAFGPRFDNHVEYVGRFDQGFLRPIERRDEFVQKLGEARLDLLLVGDRPVVSRADQPEVEWAKSAGYRVVGRDSRFTLLEAPA